MGSIFFYKVAFEFISTHDIMGYVLFFRLNLTRLKRIESKIAREAVSKTQNTFKTQNSSKTQTCLNLFNMIQIVMIHMILKHV